MTDEDEPILIGYTLNPPDWILTPTTVWDGLLEACCQLRVAAREYAKQTGSQPEATVESPR